MKPELLINIVEKNVKKITEKISFCCLVLWHSFKKLCKIVNFCYSLQIIVSYSKSVCTYLFKISAGYDLEWKYSLLSTKCLLASFHLLPLSKMTKITYKCHLNLKSTLCPKTKTFFGKIMQYHFAHVPYRFVVECNLLHEFSITFA